MQGRSPTRFAGYDSAHSSVLHGFAISSKFQSDRLLSWMRPSVGKWPSYPNPSSVICWSLACDWWLLPVFCGVA